MESDNRGLEENVKSLLIDLGQNTSREGLRNTPARYVRFLKDFLEPKEFEFTTFKNEGIDEMITVSNIPFFSLCEHHLLPFFGTATIAYIPDKKIIGLSKIPRVLNKYTSDLQNQERITKQVADFLQEKLKCKGVAVSLKARHLCMEMRGVKSHDTYTTTTTLLGAFKEKEPRAEFLSLIK